MFSKKEYSRLLFSAISVFCLIAVIIYVLYPRSNHKPVAEQPQVEGGMEEDREVMKQDIAKVKADTNIRIEIVDQFGIVSKAQEYKGINWLGYTKPQMDKAFSEYVITKYGEDEVVLTKLVERRIDPQYILTINKGKLVIAIKRNGHKILYRETDLGKGDLSKGLVEELERGISITSKEKDRILENSDTIHMILQEYDE